MRQFLVEVMLSRPNRSYYQTETVLLEARSVGAAKYAARKVAQKKRPGWTARLIDRDDGPMYRVIKFIKG